MQKWLVEEFDYVLKRYKGTYWNLASINFFVDSEFGLDTNAGTYLLPFKTLGKAQTVASNGHKVMINGTFTELLTLSKSIRWIGVGGGIGSLAIFDKNIDLNVANMIFDNIYFLPGGAISYYLTTTLHFYASNSILSRTLEASTRNIYSYHCKFISCNVVAFGAGNVYFQGNNNTLYGCIKGSGNIYLYGNNNHINNSLAITTNGGMNNILNTNGAYLDPTNLNFNFLNTSPLYRTGTAVYEGGIVSYCHVGAGQEGINENASTAIFTAAGGATLNNVAASGTELYRPNVAIDGTLLTYYGDFGVVRNKVVFDIFNTFIQISGVMYRLIQESAGLTVRNGFDYILYYGNSTAEVDSCPALLMEFGKTITVSGTGANRKGNADPNFDIANYTTPSFQYHKRQFRLKSYTP